MEGFTTYMAPGKRKHQNIYREDAKGIKTFLINNSEFLGW